MSDDIVLPIDTFPGGSTYPRVTVKDGDVAVLGVFDLTTCLSTADAKLGDMVDVELAAMKRDLLAHIRQLRTDDVS